MGINELDVLRWLHILAMVYWLGGEWGVFQASYNVINRDLPMAERRRHMETAYRIDILARTGIILLLPLGLHMGSLLYMHDYGGSWLVIMWLLFAAWLSLTWMAFVKRETDAGIRLTKIDEAIRFVVIPLLLIASISSLLGHGPFLAGAGNNWFATKLLIYALLLVIGLKLRFVMREWTVLFRRLATEGDSPQIEAVLDKSIRQARMLAYVYWVGIASVAFLGATKAL
ncbi:MAG: hypothetical protein OXD47_11070 [Gammaproteobacteria bacterium]|nr:hypothetical protein [Gammaproteobacteria bacterium]MCY4211789.1 hypothetical protein [Gammaproteobacteria bacterium]MCY4283387.1 hypothetical protein [Gammaproteobacteria bacterium]MCY4339314.1 hypothetical protein [Gammaproteobacteria bacterium]